ncbi:MAG: hypothetical protein M3O70_02235 [Actinomycetota bacterium]|nr:hypothetical protein [Actinomycetota bacterium]
MPVGGDTRLIDCGVEGTDCVMGNYYWSLGLAAIWVTTELIGREIHIVLFDANAVLLGLLITIIATLVTYWRVSDSRRKRASDSADGNLRRA